MHLNEMYSNTLVKHTFKMLSNILKCNRPKCPNQMDPYYN